jgi:hypothetical protein
MGGRIPDILNDPSKALKLKNNFLYKFFDIKADIRYEN